MTIGVDHIQDPAALRAKLMEQDDKIRGLEFAVSNFVQNVSLSVQSSGFAVVTQPDQPPHPSSGTLIWVRERSGQPTVFYISGVQATGAKTWLWIAETT